MRFTVIVSHFRESLKKEEKLPTLGEIIDNALPALVTKKGEYSGASYYAVVSNEHRE